MTGIAPADFPTNPLSNPAVGFRQSAGTFSPSPGGEGGVRAVIKSTFPPLYEEPEIEVCCHFTVVSKIAVLI